MRSAISTIYCGLFKNGHNYSAFLLSFFALFKQNLTNFIVKLNLFYPVGNYWELD